MWVKKSNGDGGAEKEKEMCLEKTAHDSTFFLDQLWHAIHAILDCWQYRRVPKVYYVYLYYNLP